MFILAGILVVAGLIIVIGIAFETGMANSRKGPYAVKPESVDQQVSALQTELAAVKSQAAQTLKTLAQFHKNNLEKEESANSQISDLKEQIASLQETGARLAGMRAQITQEQKNELDTIKKDLAEFQVMFSRLSPEHGQAMENKLAIQQVEVEKLAEKIKLLKFDGEMAVKKQSEVEKLINQGDADVRRELSAHLADQTLDLRQKYEEMENDLKKNMAGWSLLETKLIMEEQNRIGLIEKFERFMTTQTENSRKLAENLETVKTDLDGALEKFSGLNETLVPLKVEIDELREKYEHFSKQPAAKVADGMHLINRINSERGQRLKLSKEIRALETARDEQVKLFDSKIARLHGVITRKLGNRPALESLKKDVNGVKQQYTAMAKTLTALKTADAKLEDRRKERLGIEHEIKKLLGLRQDEIEEMSKKIGRLQAKLAKTLQQQADADALRLQSARAVVGMPAVIEQDKKIAETLLSRGLIDQGRLNDALSYHKKFGGTITNYLETFGYIDEQAVAGVTASQMGLPYSPFTAADIPANTTGLLPFETIHRYRVLPLYKRDDVLHILMSDPWNLSVHADLEKAAGCRIQPHMGTVSDILTGIEKYYRPDPAARRIIAAVPPADAADIFNRRYFDRRISQRFEAQIDVSFSYQGRQLRFKTKNISPFMFMFESPRLFPLGATFDVKFGVPKKFCSQPVIALTQVARATATNDKVFRMGMRHVRINKQGMIGVLEYAKQLAATK